MMTVPNPVTQAACLRLASWFLISSLCVSSAQGNNDAEILRQLDLATLSYGVLPNMHTLIELASNSSTSPETRQSGGKSCVMVVTLKNSLEHTFSITKESKSCSAFFKTEGRAKLTFRVSNLTLYPCDEEYLHINDGATLESTLCDGKASVESRRSQFLFVQYGRVTKTGTAFNITVKAVPDGDVDTEFTNKNKILEKSFMDGQICQGCGYTTRNIRQPRVLGGYPASVIENPWMVGVHITRSTADLNSNDTVRTFCGASILDRKNVLTAAHCIKPVSTSKYPRVTGLHVVAGSELSLYKQDTDVNGQKIDVADWVAHSLYNPDVEPGKSYDIAVLRLSNELRFNHRVAPVCLAAPLDFLGADVTVTGYGFVVSQGTTARQLQAVKLGVRPSDACDTTFKRVNEKFIFQSHQVCIYSPSKDACQGDSGGPAVLKWANRSYQVGIVSFGLDCADPNIRMRHGGYTRVSSFIPWIKSLLQGNSTC